MDMASAPSNPIYPWKFLGSPLPMSSSSSPPPKKTFAQALTNSFVFSLSQLKRPCLKGEAISIKISEYEYQMGIQSCKNSLHGRLILSKGETPIKTQDLRSKLANLWKPLG